MLPVIGGATRQRQTVRGLKPSSVVPRNVCHADQLPVSQLVEDADYKPFQCILNNQQHTQYKLGRSSTQTYSYSPTQVTRLHATL